MLELMGDQGRKSTLSENIQQMGIPDASGRIASEVLKLVKSV